MTNMNDKSLEELRLEEIASDMVSIIEKYSKRTSEEIDNQVVFNIVLKNGKVLNSKGNKKEITDKLNKQLADKERDYISLPQLTIKKSEFSYIQIDKFNDK